jgi:predicted ATPase/DNA-binding CsgD family transcriptional regulator
MARTTSSDAVSRRLLGRDADLEAVARTLTSPECRLLTLTGPPGVGKTTLAAAVAERVGRRFADGVCRVNLAASSDAGGAVGEIAREVGTARGSAGTAAEQLARQLAHREFLLVLDSCERVHGLGACLAPLLRQVSRTRVLATSRERLMVGLEHVIAVRPLAVPSESAIDDLTALAQVPSVALLLERAAVLQPQLRLNAQNAAAIVRICRQLEGLPLALEVAAARLRDVEPQDLALRLRNRGLLLDESDETGRSLRNAIGWSHRTLCPAERALFARLAVFPADWSMVAAVHVAGDDIDLLAAMTGLVEKNLVRAARRAGGGEGLTMLDSLREFAVEQLDRSGDRLEFRRRHRDYFAALAAEVEVRMATVDEGTSVEWLVTEHVNIEAALGCAIETADVSTGLPLATAVGWFWHCHGRLVEAGNVIEAMLDAAERAGARGTLPSAVAGASLAAAVVALDRSDLIRAGRLLRAVIALSDPDTHARRHAAAHAFLGHVARMQGQLTSARHQYGTALALYRDLGNDRGVAWAWHDLGLLAVESGDLEVAGERLSAALAWFDGARDVWATAWARSGLALVAIHRADWDAAVRLLDPAMQVYADNGDLPRIATCLRLYAAVAAGRRRAESALQLLAAADAIHSPLARSPRSDTGAAVRTAAEAVLDGPQVTQAAAYGSQLSVTGAVRLARQAAGPASLATVALTARQLEVAALVADGRTNRQIARALGIAERTADAHVAQIMERLGVHSRAAIAAAAARAPGASR